MKILGIDFGTKRIGLAISDELGVLARELDIMSPDIFWNSIVGIIQEQNVNEVAVGLPLNMSGTDSDKTHQARKFASELEQKIIVPVKLVDERLSSQMAEQISGTRHNIDSLAAQIFLQNYLDQLNKQNK